MESVPPDAEALLAHSDFLRALVRRLLRDEERAADVVQDTWVAAIEHPPRDRRGLRAWLATVALNFARRARRDERLRRAPAPPRPPHVPTPEEILAREEARHRVVLAVLGLPEPYRSTVVLRFLEELPPREVARRMGVPVETVRTRLKRALARLREGLDDAYGERKAWSLALLPLALPRRAVAPLLGAFVVNTKMKILAALALCALAGVLWSWRSASLPEDVPARTVDRPLGSLADGTSEASQAAPSPATAEADAWYPEGTTIAGRVLADGVPLAGAYVALRRGDALVARVEATDAEGRFAFSSAGTFTVVAAHPRRLPARLDVAAVAGERRDVDIELPEAPSVGILVLDARTDEPIAAAEILVLRSGEAGASCNAAIVQMIEHQSDLTALAGKYDVFDNPEEWFSLLKGEQMLYIPPIRTDAAGRAEAGGLLTPEFDAIVTHPAYTPRLVKHGGDGGELVVRLERGMSLTVVAPRFGGVPLAGHVCEIDRPGLIPMPVRRTVLDEGGRAVLTGLRPGTYVLSISRNGLWLITSRLEEEEDEEGNVALKHMVSAGRHGTALLTRQVNVVAGADPVLDFSALEGARIAGRIESQTAGKAAWIVRLMEGPGFERPVAETHPDEEGRFAFERVAPGSYVVTATGVMGGRAEITAPCEVRSPDGTVEVVLRTGTGLVSGTVIDAGGQPVAEAMILMLPEGPARDALRREPRTLDDLVTMLVAHAESREDGAFEVPELRAGTYTLLCVRGNCLAREPIRLADGERRRADIRLAEPSLFPVTIRLAGPAPGDGTVRVRDEDGGFLVAAALEAERLDGDEGNVFRYHLSPGRYRIDAFADDLAPRLDQALEVSGPSEIALTLEPGVKLTLVIEDSHGPVSGRVVELLDRGLRVGGDMMRDPFLFAPPRTDAEGRAVFPHVLPGNYAVRVDGQDAVVVDVGRAPAERSVRIGPQ